MLFFCVFEYIFYIYFYVYMWSYTSLWEQNKIYRWNEIKSTPSFHISMYSICWFWFVYWILSFFWEKAARKKYLGNTKKYEIFIIMQHFCETIFFVEMYIQIFLFFYFFNIRVTLLWRWCGFYILSFVFRSCLV